MRRLERVGVPMLGEYNQCQRMILLHSTAFHLLTLWLDHQTYKKSGVQGRTAVCKVSLVPIFVKSLLSPSATPCYPFEPWGAIQISPQNDLKWVKTMFNNLSTMLNYKCIPYSVPHLKLYSLI